MGGYQRGPERAGRGEQLARAAAMGAAPVIPHLAPPRLTRLHVCVALAFLSLCSHTFLLLGALGRLPRRRHRPHSLGRGGWVPAAVPAPRGTCIEPGAEILAALCGLILCPLCDLRREIECSRGQGPRDPKACRSGNGFPPFIFGGAGPKWWLVAVIVTGRDSISEIGMRHAPSGSFLESRYFWTL